MLRKNGLKKNESAKSYLPANKSLSSMRQAVQNCHGCDLYKKATQAVFGEGPARARIMLVGEQPGDSEDKQGHPFVGPAGQLLHKALIEAGITRDTIYFTNAVKHFKYEWRGQRRIHAKPRRIEVAACMPWLEAEIARVKPDVIICLGATAALALLGPKFRLTKQRGLFIESDWAPHVMATIHPSAILRAGDRKARHAEMSRFIDDLKEAAVVLAIYRELPRMA